MNWHRKRQIITLLFVAGIALLAAMGGVSVYLDSRVVEQNAELSRLRDRVVVAADMLAALIDIETGVRGYLIAGDPTYLEPYYRGRDTVTHIVGDTGPEVMGWSAPGLGGETLGTLMPQRGKLMEAAIATVGSQGTAAAQAQLNASNAKALMDAMRTIVGHQLDDFNQQADDLKTDADFLADLHSVLVVISLALAVLFSTAQFLLFRSEINGRGAMELALRQRNEERRQVADLSAALQLSDSRHEAYGIIETFARRMLSEASGAFYVYTASRDQLTLVAQWNRPGETHKFADHLHPSECWGLRQGGRHTGSIDALAQTGIQPGSDVSPVHCRHIADEAGAYTCIPIIGRGQILAMLHLRSEKFRTAKAAAPWDGLVERLTDQLSLSLTNIELRERLENMALRDGLTGLYNRRFIDEMLDHQLAKLRRDGKKAAFLLLDVDHFKRFNDTYGHQAGDEALRKVGAALTATVRASDVVCRYGGEEFLVFLPECGAEEALVKTEAIRHAISVMPLKIVDANIPPVTASIGVAIYPDAATARIDLIQLADRALYRAKAEGRDRVVLYEPAAENSERQVSVEPAK
jgi:diguanylate cyclase (GGDEF)-like protein